MDPPLGQARAVISTFFDPLTVSSRFKAELAAVLFGNTNSPPIGVEAPVYPSTRITARLVRPPAWMLMTARYARPPVFRDIRPIETPLPVVGIDDTAKDAATV